MCTMYGLMKDPYLPIAHHKMKSRTPLVSHQRGDAIESPSYLTRCMQGWDHKRLVKTGRVQPQPRRPILVPQSHPSRKIIPHTNRYNESEEKRQVKPPRIHQQATGRHALHAFHLLHYQLRAPKRVSR